MQLRGRRRAVAGVACVLAWAGTARAQVAEFDTTQSVFYEAPTRTHMFVYTPSGEVQVSPAPWLDVRGGWEADVVSGASVAIKAGPAFTAKSNGADGRNAVFYGERAIDRSPCGTGTSARLAHLAYKGKLKPGDRFVHESYICSRFIGRVEEATKLGDYDAIIPSIEGSAIATGFNQIWIDDEDPFWRGFQVT